MVKLRAMSPLDGRRFEGTAVHIAESTEFSFIHLKGHHPEPDDLTDIGPDVAPLSFDGKIVWIGPNERLLLDSRDTGLLLAHLDVSPPSGYFTRNASSGLIAIEVKGRSTTRLMQGETDAITFASGFASRMRIADLAVIVLVPAPDHILCLVERSAARWLFDWFVDRASALNL